MSFLLHDRHSDGYGMLLESGLHLNQREFHARYARMPNVRKAELIDGVVLMGSPVSNWHAEKSAWIARCFAPFCDEVDEVQLGLTGSVILDHENEVQPDVFLRFKEEASGQSKLAGDYIHGAPELIVELAFSSHAYDLYEKLAAYQRSKVQEYIVWLGEENEFRTFRLSAKRLKPIDSAESFQSITFPGLVLDLKALRKGDLKAALRSAKAALKSPEFAAFQKQRRF